MNLVEFKTLSHLFEAAANYKITLHFDSDWVIRSVCLIVKCYYRIRGPAVEISILARTFEAMHMSRGAWFILWDINGKCQGYVEKGFSLHMFHLVSSLHSCERKVSIVVSKTIIVPICAIQDQHQALLASHGRDREQRETPFISRKCEKDGTHGKGWCI